MQLGDTLKLHRESDYQYDSNAIELYWKEQKIGYVPRSHNSVLSRLMDEGNRVTGFEHDHWMPVRFGVGLVIG